MSGIYDVIIIGGGPAGLSAALYAGRARLKTLLVEKGNIGGLITITNDIENYPGSIKGDSGNTLTERMREQAISFGCEIVIDEIESVDVSKEIKLLIGGKDRYEGKSVIIASGGTPRLLGCMGEQEHIGMGVSYCATCDGPLFGGLEVYVIGGGSSAIEEAIFLTRYARKVTIIHRRKEFRAEKILMDKALKNPKIHFLLDTVVREIKGDGPTNELILRNTETGEIISVHADENDGYFGVFIFTGYTPASKLWDGILSLTSEKYIITNNEMETSIKGIYAAGDVVEKVLRQVVTAASDGVIAAFSASKYIDEK
ncbi:MAG: thioredoxin-disulfide reductase [Eubacteriales bacterium]